ncbi:unnamed protein product [Spirodela intermedia]|uniref:Uncharacterized protein n=2 Tax=Spirodela intermedia TaxID=51605 RepID=A0A7I8KT48_SPIIN|nr:unnamed protein product [Spirodela intermedia]CAA6663781.1 unnamed protein product [Spirodela intermedia]CAA7400278.1 unnamed protein product [Spirodela intermedia]
MHIMFQTFSPCGKSTYRTIY